MYVEKGVLNDQNDFRYENKTFMKQISNTDLNIISAMSFPTVYFPLYE